MIINGKCRCPGCMQELHSEDELCECGYDVSQKNDDHCLQIGTVLNNKYIIGKIIGEGGFGITYVGWDQDLEMKVAIKEFYLSGHTNRNTTVSSDVIANSGTSEELFGDYREKFISEARILASFLKESGIVTILNFFRDNNTAYIIMEFLEGENLKDYLKRNGRIPTDYMLEMIFPVIESMAKVHSTNLIHRDISPDNIVIGKDGKCILLDFGAAREVANNQKSMSVILKHGYAPPEQYQSHGNQGPWTDVYAMCATIYKCITGQTPEEAVSRTMGAGLRNPNEIEPSCSEEVGRVLLKGMELQPEKRYQSMTELYEELKKAINPARCNYRDDATVLIQEPQYTEKQSEVFDDKETKSKVDKKKSKYSLDKNYVLTIISLLVIIYCFFGGALLQEEDFYTEFFTVFLISMSYFIFYEVKSKIEEFRKRGKQ